MAIASALVAATVACAPATAPGATDSGAVDDRPPLVDDLAGSAAPATDTPSLPSTTGARTLPSWSEQGEASWYGPGFAGKLTANGEIFDPSLLTAAHPSLPFDTRVRVTLASTGRSVVVRINDRGPFAKGRIIDLSRAAAEQIGLLAIGVGEVELTLAGGPGGAREVRTDVRLIGYDVVVPGAREGALIVLRTLAGIDLVVRAVVLDPSPIDASDDGTEIWVSPGLAERVGGVVTVVDEGTSVDPRDASNP